MGNDIDVSKKSTALAIVCCGLIVLLHSGNMSVNITQQRFSAFWENLFSREISAIAVPMFFAISGYWAGRLFTPPLAAWYRKTISKKVSTLLLPYLAWCTIYALTALPFTVLGNNLAGRPAIHNTCLADTAFSLQNLCRIYGGNLMGIPADGPLWFVRNLMLLFLISPLLVMPLRNMRIGAAACAAVLGCFIFQDFLPLNHGHFFETGFSLRGLLFFGIGMFAAFHPGKFPAASPKLTVALAAAFIGMAICGSLYVTYGLNIPPYMRIMDRLMVLSGMTALWFGYDFCHVMRRLSELPCVKYCFFVYAAHFAILGTLFCARTNGILSKVFFGADWPVYIIRFTATMALAAAAAKLTRRLLPAIYRMLSGDR